MTNLIGLGEGQQAYSVPNVYRQNSCSLETARDPLTSHESLSYGEGASHV